VTKWRRVWNERFPRLGLDVVAVPQADQRAALDQQRVDLCFVRLPLPDDGLHVIPLYTEVLVVVVAKDHPVSLFDKVSLADLDGEQVLKGFDDAEALDLVAGGVGVVLLPQSVARSFSRRDLVHRPVSDGTATQVGLAWLRDNEHELIEKFIGIVRGRTPNSTRSLRPSPELTTPDPKTRPSRPAGSATGGTGQHRRNPGRRTGRPRRGR